MRYFFALLAVIGALVLPSSALATAPTYVGQVQVSSWTTTTQGKTATVAVQSGDLIVAYGATETQSATLSIAGGGLTWAPQQEVNVNNYTHTYAWTTTATSTGNVTATFTRSATAKEYGGGLLVYRNAAVGATAKANGSGAPSLSLTTTNANSEVAVLSSDWNAVSGTTRTWRTGAGTATELLYARDSVAYTVYAARHADAGSIGAKTLGLSVPTGQAYSTIGVEVKGTATGDTTPPDTTITSNPTNPTTSTSASFGFSSSESGSTFQCQLDGGGYSSCTTPKAYTGLTVGSHTFTVKATDAASNTDPTPASYTWTITSGGSTSNCFADPSACGYPDVDNTGPRISLTDVRTASLPSGAAWDSASGVLRITANNVSLSGYDIPGSVTVDGNNFHLTDSKIHVDTGCGSYPCGNYGIRLGQSGAAVSGTVLSYDDIVVPANIGLPNATGATKVEFGVRNNGDTTASMDHSYVAGYSDAWHAQGSITDSYLTGQLVQTGDHMEAFVNGGEGNPTTLDHNTILTFPTNTGEAGSADIAFYDDFGNIGSVTVKNNLLAGGQYLMEGGAKTGTGFSVTGPVTVRDNRIARSAGSSPDSHGFFPNGGNLGLWTDFNSAATTSCGNVWDDNGTSTGNPPSSTTC